MNRDDVIRMAKQADDSMFCFAALIESAATERANERANASWALMCEKMVAAEREACAKVCEKRAETLARNLPTGFAAKYFPRGAESESTRCAAAIRARGQK